MYSIYHILVLTLSIVCSTYADYAPFINKCKWEDSNCIKESTQKIIPIFANGLPELGVDKLDPFQMKSLDASTSGLKLKIRDITGHGLKDCVAKKVQLNKAKSELIAQLQCTVDFTGKYEMKGRLLVLPIEGKGDAHVILRKAIITAEIDLGNREGRNGATHWAIKSWKHSYDLKDKSTIELQNLFNGNQVLGFAARELLKNNSNEIVKAIGPPIVKAVVAKIIENVESFFQHVPASELTSD